jgi:hypothetical protein
VANRPAIRVATILLMAVCPSGGVKGWYWARNAAARRAVDDALHPVTNVRTEISLPV